MIEINIYVINYIVVSNLRDDHKRSSLTRNVKLEIIERLLVFYYIKNCIKK